jgi:hypothetical protein
MNPTDDCYWRKADIGQTGLNVRFRGKADIAHGPIHGANRRKNGDRFSPIS